MRELVIPPPAQEDKDSFEIIRAWVADNGLHCTINVGTWEDDKDINEEDAWGIVLADVIRHFSNAMNDRYGNDKNETIMKTVKSLFAELEIPTSEVKGQFWDH